MGITRKERRQKLTNIREFCNTKRLTKNDYLMMLHTVRYLSDNGLIPFSEKIGAQNVYRYGDLEDVLKGIQNIEFQSNLF